MRTRQIQTLMIVVLAASLILACDVASLTGGSAKPTIVIQSPANNSQFREGEDVAIQSIANDPSGIASVDLTVDGVTSRTDKPLPGQTGPLFTLTQKWKASAGTHTLGVRAYNASGVASDVVTVTVSIARGAAVAPSPTAPVPTPVAPSPTTPVPTPVAAATRAPTTSAATALPPSGASGRIAFIAERDGNMEVYLMTPDGSGQTRLTNNTVDETKPAWSPDGARIAFTSKRDGNTEIYQMNADGSGQTRLTNNPATDTDPAWSPDGKQIIFSSTRDNKYEVYVMNADGSQATRLTNTSGDNWSPAWQPSKNR